MVGDCVVVAWVVDGVVAVVGDCVVVAWVVDGLVVVSGAKELDVLDLVVVVLELVSGTNQEMLEVGLAVVSGTHQGLVVVVGLAVDVLDVDEGVVVVVVGLTGGINQNLSGLTTDCGNHQGAKGDITEMGIGNG